MSITNKIIMAGLAIYAAVCGIAYAQNLGGMGQNIGGGISTTFDGGLSGYNKGAGAAPSSCTGTINFSTGCVEPMVGH